MESYSEIPAGGKRNRSGEKPALYAEPSGVRTYQGHGVSSGVALGVVVKLEKRRLPVFKLRIAKSRIDDELKKLQLGVERSKEQILAIRKRLGEQVGEEHAYILEAQLLMLEDRVMLKEISEIIREYLVNAEWAVRNVTDRYLHAYRSLTEEYYRERGCDLADVRTRIITNIAGHGGMDFTLMPKRMVLFVEELDPSTVSAVDYRKIQAFVAEVGGWTSHAAILARSLQIPAVAGLPRIVQEVSSGERVIVDGDAGVVILSPDRELLRSYRRGIAARKAHPMSSEVIRPSETVTRDGQQVIIQATTDLMHEVAEVNASGVCGIGLFRSEFLFLNSQDGLPGEEEQFETFKEVAHASSERPIVLRTFDIGPDKFLKHADLNAENSPTPLGLRGLRFCLREKDFFRAHLRAIIRASAFGPLRVVLPFVADLGELRAAKSLIAEVTSELQAAIKGVPQIPVGVMVEVPSAVCLANALARESDFLCIGTNDLIQYTLVVDRMNGGMSRQFQPLHPAILRSILKIVEAASENGRPLIICGEAAGDPLFVYAAIGMGGNNFSVNMNAISGLRKSVTEISFAEAQMTSKELLRLDEFSEVQSLLRKGFLDSTSRVKRLWFRQHSETYSWKLK